MQESKFIKFQELETVKLIESAVNIARIRKLVFVKLIELLFVKLLPLES